MEKIFAIIFFIILFIILFLVLFKTIFEYYIQYSKKYKDFHIVDEISKIADKNKAIVTLECIEEIWQYVILIDVVVFTLGIALLSNADTFKLQEKIIQLLIYANIVVFSIWTVSILITSIYYIISYVKEIKIIKKNNS